MQINLKQHEIVSALKQYIAQKGIQLQGKDVKISFTAGRKETGISAEMLIEDSDIPGYTTGDTAGDDTEDKKEPGLVVVPSSKPPQETEAASLVAAVEEPVDAVVSVTEPTAKPNSLFN